MQKDDDPFRDFAEGDRTVFVPTPGGRRRGGAAAVSTPLPPIGNDPAAAPPGRWVEGVGRNPLINAAAPLFALVERLRGLRRHDDVTGLRRDVISAVREFDSHARRMGIDAKTAAQAGYALCALIDETVLGTPWGLDSIWGKQSLLITFYREYAAGEKFFSYLDEIQKQQRQYIDLLEFFYICLSLGFHGKFRFQDGGSDQLARVRHELFVVTRQVRGEHERELSPHWMGVTDRRPAVSRFVPLWVAGAVAIAAVLVAFVALNYNLNDLSDRVYAKINGLAVAAVPNTAVVPPAAPIPTVRPKAADERFIVRLRRHLDSEIRAGLVSVEDMGNAARIILFNRDMFPSGRADVGTAAVPLIHKIGAFIAERPGPFHVTGHTDNIPIRSVQFGSNWHLSKARAQSVAALLAEPVGDARKITIEGRADTEPMASNATADGRALNRRVEISIPLT
jgi:type VI secretion system protein ImpK